MTNWTVEKLETRIKELQGRGRKRKNFDRKLSIALRIDSLLKRLAEMKKVAVVK